jgi:hypothetical protein
VVLLERKGPFSRFLGDNMNVVLAAVVRYCAHCDTDRAECGLRPE